MKLLLATLKLSGLKLKPISLFFEHVLTTLMPAISRMKNNIEIDFLNLISGSSLILLYNFDLQFFLSFKRLF